MFVFDKLSKDKNVEFWRCHFRDKCKVRLRRLVSTGKVLLVSGSHSDASDAAAVEVAQRRTAMKRRAQETQETPAQIINHVQVGASQAAQVGFPVNSLLSKQINRVRKACSTASAIPAHRSLIKIPENYAVYETSDGVFESFVIADSGLGDQDRILIFGRSSTRDWIGYAKKLYVDGTFSLTPELFSQIFVVLAERSGFVIPVCYALLPNKTFSTYARMLEMLCEAWPELKPEKVSLDFETGLIRAFRERFPDATMNGCLFHLVKRFNIIDALYILEGL